MDTRAGEGPNGPRGGARDPARRLALLERWIERHADPPGSTWFREALATAAGAADSRTLVRSVALVPRRLGKRDLVLAGPDLREADGVRPGFDPSGLTLDQAARIALLLASYRDPATFAQAIEALCQTADLGEFIAVYRGLALFPAPEHLVGRAAEGVRSGIKPIFEAVAHRNPYPAEMFDRSTWNQMVLKALFIGSELRLIQRLDERANAELAAILVDYAHERWSAGRPVSPELWRCVGPFADRRAVADLERVLETGAAAERNAAALALSASNEPAARAILGRHRDLEAAVISGRLDWAGIGAHGST